MGRLIEEMGFSAMYLSGAAFSAGVVGMPDVGLFTLTELAQHVQYLTAQVDTPVIVDADTGFGDTANVERTIVELETGRRRRHSTRRPGTAETLRPPLRASRWSQPTRCARKSAAAVAARSDESLVIIARTDARGV